MVANTSVLCQMMLGQWHQKLLCSREVTTTMLIKPKNDNCIITITIETLWASNINTIFYFRTAHLYQEDRECHGSVR